VKPHAQCLQDEIQLTFVEKEGKEPNGNTWKFVEVKKNSGA
jgi:hypothetical protein